jgi:penicillin-binding protein 1A
MRRFASFILWSIAAISCGSVLVLAAAYLYLNPQIPEAASFKNVKLRAPLSIYSADNKLIQEFGERLVPITYDEIPPLFVHALLDTEDKRFFEHSGIDLITLVNASWQLVRNKGAIRTGASTITMQLVKNISGDTEVRFIRKFKEMLLALKIEQELSKEDILTLYLNMIPFGKHAFGLQAAAHTYYGKEVAELELAQLAMLAGIPQAPEAGNPVNGPERALARRNLVLLRMLEQDSISKADYEIATQAPITAQVYARAIELPALYLAEMVRKRLLSQMGSNAYNEGMIVHTTLDSRKQLAAENALIRKLNEYDRRHGYRGPEARRLQGTDEFLAAPEYGYPTTWRDTLDNARVVGDQYPAIVLAVRDREVDVLTQDLQRTTLGWDSLSWARAYLSVNSRGPAPKTAADLVAIGDLIRIERRPTETSTAAEPTEAAATVWGLGQVPAIQGALVSLDPKDGAVRALVGGYDFNAKQFNNATQARRQPGSNFKPFFYAGALENGLTAASIYNDAPVVLPGGEQEEVYRPTNSGDVFHGNIRLREALYRSINLVSLRVILDFGPTNAIRYVKRFGFDTSNFPVNVQLAFGGGTIALTPMEVVTGYATFANGGHKIEPYFIREIDSINADPIFLAKPVTVCSIDCGDLPQAEQVIEPRVAYIMNSILGDVMRRGTGTKATRALRRGDLHGKTGTTNDADIWFSGYTPDLVATTWAGFSDNSPVGAREWGSTTPIETWIEYMRTALPAEADTTELPQPDRMVTLRIDPITGQRAEPGDPDAIFEMFREEMAPAARPENPLLTNPRLSNEESEPRPLQQIF